jgi:hypothetical protein
MFFSCNLETLVFTSWKCITCSQACTCSVCAAKKHPQAGCAGVPSQSECRLRLRWSNNKGSNNKERTGCGAPGVPPAGARGFAYRRSRRSEMAAPAPAPWGSYILRLLARFGTWYLASDLGLRTWVSGYCVLSGVLVSVSVLGTVGLMCAANRRGRRGLE